MSKQNDGGPAFPRSALKKYAADGGMTLREYYVGQALIGLMQSISLCHLLAAQIGTNVEELLGAIERQWDTLGDNALRAADKALEALSDPAQDEDKQ